MILRSSSDVISENCVRSLCLGFTDIFGRQWTAMPSVSTDVYNLFVEEIAEAVGKCSVCRSVFWERSRLLTV